MKPGCTSVSTMTGLSSPSRRNRIPSSRTSNQPPALRNTLRKVSISCCLAPPTKISPSVASAAHAQRGGLVAVEDRAVVVAAERLDALDQDHPVRLVGDDRAHLLQHRDEVHDLGLDGRVAQLGLALRAHGGEQHLLGRADARVRQVDARALQPVRGGQADAAGQLLDDRAELAQRVEVEVDRAVADAAAAEVGDERLAEAVQQRAAEQDRDAGGAGVRVDLLEVRGLHVARVEHKRAGLVALGHAHAVHLEQGAHHGDVAQIRDVAQGARRLAEEGRDHRLGGEVLRALHVHPAVQGPSAADRQDIAGECGGDRGLVQRCRHSGPLLVERARPEPPGGCPRLTAARFSEQEGYVAATTRGGPRTARSCLRCAG